HGWEKYFRDNVPKWSFSHAKSIPYSYTLGAFYEWRHRSDRIDRKATRTATPEKTLSAMKVARTDQKIEKFASEKDKNIHNEL
ncbi:hypothetical protein, partial [Endozoicomonas sp. ONNA1]|uniref:hypothetical protein n=1 Tax=Endozoicomonas sp. ONNA1 TaxID=2828740 RepID=UPI0021478864